MKKLFFFLCFLLSTTVYSQEKRLALVIGNSAYEHGGELPNPINDAFAMKQALTDVGFEVLEYFNLDEGELKKAIDEFGLKLRNYDVGLFFYAGHGIQANGENYLIPVEANLMSEQQVEYDCVEAARVLAHMDASGASVNIVILDACRNNPFERSWSRSTSGQGLAFMDAPTGTLIAYATAPGSTASDGTGRNGLYTEAILESIKIPGITILQVFQNVRSLVTERSNSQQTPWESTSLIGDFYFHESTENNTTQSYFDLSTETGDSRGISTIDLDGYVFTHKRYGRKKGIYLEDEHLSKIEFARVLIEGDHQYGKTMRTAFMLNSYGLVATATGGALFIGYSLGWEITNDEVKKKRYLT